MTFDPRTICKRKMKTHKQNTNSSSIIQDYFLISFCQAINQHMHCCLNLRPHLPSHTRGRWKCHWQNGLYKTFISDRQLFSVTTFKVSSKVGPVLWAETKHPRLQTNFYYIQILTLHKSLSILFTDVLQDVHGMGIGYDISNLKNAKPLKTLILMDWTF